MKPTRSTVGEGASLMMADARDQEREWLAALDHPAIRAKGLCAEAVRPALAEARARVLERLLQATVHESLVGEAPIGPPNDGRLVVPLARRGGSLVIECPVWQGQGLYQRFKGVWLEDGRKKTPIEGPVELIDVLAAEADEGADGDFGRFAREVGNSVLNDGLCTAYRSAWNRRIAADIADVGADGFWRWLAGGHAGIDPTLFLEQWGAVGHPYNTLHKTKLDLQPHEIISWAPEFEGRVQVRLAAVRRTRAHIETMPGTGSIEDVLAMHLPDWLAAWQARLRAGGLDPADFVPVPVHPWQAANAVPKLFAAPIAAGDVALLDGPELECVPTMSFRTVVPVGRADMPHIKLPVAIRLTSTMRTITPRSCQMGPRISRLLLDILAGDPAFDGSLAIVPEEIGIHYRDEGDGELGKHLGVLIRPNPAQFTTADEIAVPVASLMLPSPATAMPLFTDLARAAGATTPKDLRRVFRNYAETLLGDAFRLYLVYGIAFEGHQQNTLAVFHVDGGLRRIIIRDFGGIRIHRPTLWRSGRRLRLHPDRLTVVESRDKMRHKFLHSFVQHNLGALASALAGDDTAAARAFWAEIAGTVEWAFDAVRDDVADDLWRAERRAFLDDDWTLRSIARMRITGTRHDIYVTDPNPLAAVR